MKWNYIGQIIDLLKDEIKMAKKITLPEWEIWWEIRWKNLLIIKINNNIRSFNIEIMNSVALIASP